MIVRSHFTLDVLPSTTLDVTKPVVKTSRSSCHRLFSFPAEKTITKNSVLSFCVLKRERESISKSSFHSFFSSHSCCNETSMYCPVMPLFWKKELSFDVVTPHSLCVLFSFTTDSKNTTELLEKKPSLRQKWLLWKQWHWNSKTRRRKGQDNRSERGSQDTHNESVYTNKQH